MNSPVTKEFFATVQNKLHYTVTHHTAAEIVYGRADSTKPNMGLTTWKNAPQGRIRKSDVSIAKNYLNEEEMINLNEIVTMYLDYAERQARRGNIMYMRDWVNRLDAFLQFNEEDILHDKGKVTAAIAKAFAESEFEKFRVLQDRTYQSDFDRLVANKSGNPMFPILLPEVRGFCIRFTDYIKRFSGNMQGLNIHHIRLASIV